MFKVFLCEDESIVREGLRDLIPWGSYGMEFVGDAPDGEMALPMIRRTKPDILITDIKMPFMDGLSLSSIVAKELPDTKIIILSGHSDFGYAQQAISLGVDQYLLKPITKAKMVQALEKSKQKLEEEQEQRDYLRKYEQESKEFERLSRRSFFEKMVEGSMNVQEIYEQADRIHLNLSADAYNFVLFTVQDVQTSTFSLSASEVMETLLASFLRYPDDILFRCSLMSYAVLVKADKEKLSHQVKRCVDIIREHCERAPSPVSWYVAVGMPTYRLSGLAQCYAEATRTFAYRYVFPTQHIFISEQMRAERFAPTARELSEIDTRSIDPMILRSFVMSGAPGEAEAFAEEYIANLHGAERSVLFRHYLVLSVRINAELALREAGYETQELVRGFPAIDGNLRACEVKQYMAQVLGSAVEVREREAQKRRNDIIDDALRYIDQNYQDANISLNSVAEASNISANYLSALFSQKVGLSFVEYLTRKRMTKAKHLLRHSSKRSGEIAYEIGYKDPRYFSFVFKKTQGVTPSSYRNGEMDL